MIKPTPELLSAEWCVTAYGRLFHLVDRSMTRPFSRLGGRSANPTLCGRLPFESSDAPWAVWRGKPCSVCIHRHEGVAR